MHPFSKYNYVSNPMAIHIVATQSTNCMEVSKAQFELHHLPHCCVILRLNVIEATAFVSCTMELHRKSRRLFLLKTQSGGVESRCATSRKWEKDLKKEEAPECSGLTANQVERSSTLNPLITLITLMGSPLVLAGDEAV